MDRRGRRLAVGMLLAVALSAQAPQAKRLWLRLEARFVCGDLHPIVLGVLEGASSDLVVPSGCPEAGAALRLDVSCPGGACGGTVADARGVVARLEERKGSLVVTTQGERRAGPAAKLALAILGKEAVRVEEAVQARALWVGLAVSAPVAQLGARLVPGASVVTGLNRHRLELDFEWLDASRVSLRIVDSGGTRWVRALAVGREEVVPCADLGLEGGCQVTVSTGVPWD